MQVEDYRKKLQGVAQDGETIRVPLMLMDGLQVFGRDGFGTHRRGGECVDRGNVAIRR